MEGRLQRAAVLVVFFGILAVTALVGDASQTAGLTLTTLFWARLGYVVFAL